MKLKQTKDLRKLLFNIKKMMEKKKLLLVKIKFDELNSLSQLHYSDKVLREELRDELLSDNFENIKETITIHGYSSSQVHKESTVVVGKQFGFIK